MFHAEKNKPVSSQVSVTSVDSSGTWSSLCALIDLVDSCSGPDSGIHIIRNSCGGHITMTSDSGRLLASLSVSNQILKLIVSSVQGHLTEFRDGGKFLACACLSLIKMTVQESGMPTNRRAYCGLYEQFIKIVSEYLNSKECSVRVNTNLMDINVLLAYTRSVLSTRPLLNLSDSDCNNLSELLVKCFVESIPAQVKHGTDVTPCYSDGIFIVGSLHERSRESRLLKGLLLECPELPSLNGEHALSIVTAGQDDSMYKCIKVVLVTCSMSGDLEDITSATYEVTAGQASYAENLVLDKWADFCERLAHGLVGILLCQKVIHPRLKILLKSRNVVCADRLGSAVNPYIKDLTGAQAVVSVISVPASESFIGYISRARHVVLNDKSYLHLEQPKSSVVTLILCSRTEESLEEFKGCVKTSLKGLYSLLREGKLLAGAGCWQTHCSYVLDEQVKKRLSTLADVAGCSKAQVLSALWLFRSAVFHQWLRVLWKGHENVQNPWDMLMIDSETKHCWRMPSGFSGEDSTEKKVQCCCGLKSSILASASSTHKIFGFQSFVMADPSCYKNQERINSPSSGANNDCSCTPFESPSSVFHTETLHAAVNPCLSCSSMDQPVTINSTLDHFSAALQGLYKAVFTANLVLSLGQIISDG